MKIEIKSSQTRERKGTSSKTGNAYCFYQQEAWAHLPTAPYPIQIDLTWNAENQALPVGLYQLSPESFYVDRNKNLSIKPILIPLKQEDKGAAA